MYNNSLTYNATLTYAAAADGLVGPMRASTIVRSNAEILTAYQSGTLTIDQYTTFLASLTATVGNDAAPCWGSAQWG
jgi:ADP-heptose:LPS heptosyltransferase